MKDYGLRSRINSVRKSIRFVSFFSSYTFKSTRNKARKVNLHKFLLTQTYRETLAPTEKSTFPCLAVFVTEAIQTSIILHNWVSREKSSEWQFVGNLERSRFLVLSHKFEQKFPSGTKKVVENDFFSMENESSFRICFQQKGVEKVTKVDVKASIFKLCLQRKQSKNCQLNISNSKICVFCYSFWKVKYLEILVL